MGRPQKNSRSHTDMDPLGFLPSMDSGAPFILQSGLNGLQGLNPLATISGIGVELPPDIRGRSKLAREEALLEAKVVQIIISDPQSLKPNSGRSVAVGDHHICVAYHDDLNSGYRVWEWHGHILMFDEENGYVPEYVYGSFFHQPLKNNGNELASVMSSLGLSGALDRETPVVRQDAKK